MILIRVSTPKFTAGCIVNPEHGCIEKAAPILRKFIGQPQENLEKWVKQIGGELTRTEIPNANEM